MKHIEEYLKDVIKVEPLGKLTTMDDELYGMSGEMVYIDGKCSDIFISHADYVNWLEKQGEKEYALKSLKDVDVRKFIQFFEKQAKAYEIELPNRSYDIYALAKDILTWLEKQNEQTPVDNVEPKFKVGDWVVDNCGYTWKIEGILNQFYLLEGVEGGESLPTIEWVNKTFHLWAIQDAKPGDVLAAHECIVLFKEIDGLNIKCHCTYHFMTNPSFYVNTLQNKSAFHPATKEQRELLFQKMKEAGYKWENNHLEKLNYKEKYEAK